MACYLLAGCETFSMFAPEKPPVPDGSTRVPVNRIARAPERGSASAGERNAPATRSAPARQTLTLEARTVEGKTVRVSLLSTLGKIAANTGLRLRDNDLADEMLPIVPSDDPFDVLRQLAGKTRYRISLDRATGRLSLSDEERAAGVVVLRDSQPVKQIGSPIALAKMPEKSLPMIDALRLLAPSDFEVGYIDDIDPNIRVDLSQATSWLDGLERVAMQTPYRVVFDWDKKLVYAAPVAGKRS
jgi:hypothetical protein